VPSITRGGLLTLDLAGTVGWAYGPLNAVAPIFGHWDRPRFGGEGALYVAFENTLQDVVEEFGPGRMLLEKPLGLPAQTDMRSCRQQLTLRGFAVAEAHRSSIAVSEIDAYTARLEVIGTGWFAKGTVKAEVIRHCRARGVMVTDHNEADAVILWFWERQRLLGIPRIVGPLGRWAAERDAVGRNEIQQ
jgi:hypothetical protein